MMDYKGYIGHVTHDAEADIFHGEVINTRDVITFQGTSISELTAEFKKSVDVYLAFCKKRGRVPAKPFSGKFNLRLPPELHREAFIAAKEAGNSLNSFVVGAIKQSIKVKT